MLLSPTSCPLCIFLVFDEWSQCLFVKLNIHLFLSSHFTNSLVLDPSFSSSCRSTQQVMSNFKSPFKMEGGFTVDAKAKSGYTSSKKGFMVVGLQSLMYKTEGQSINVVTKSGLRTSGLRLQASNIEEYCYLKSCYLCSKKLSLDKDVYMYRGDQGFCSIECRNRQIVLDEMKEVEESTKQRLKSDRHCSTTAGLRDTRLVLKELRRPAT